MAGPKYRRMNRTKYEMGSDENRYFRSVAYRRHIQLVYGYLRKRRIPQPACAYYAIRSKFGGKDFQGYDDDEESL